MTDVDELPASTVEWLSLIRYEALVAEEQSRLGRPLSSLAINTVQDAVESILSLAVQTLGGNVASRPDFLQLFDAASSLDTSNSLSPFRAALQAMNNARVSFKHHGNSPSDTSIGRH